MRIHDDDAAPLGVVLVHAGVAHLRMWDEQVEALADSFRLIRYDTRGWGKTGVVDFVEFCRVLTNFTSSRCLLGAEFREDPVVDATIDADLRALAGMPGVKAAVNTNFLPWQGGGSSNTAKTPGKTDVFQTQVYVVTPGIFDTLNAPVTEGRAFQDSDYGYTTDEDGQATTVVISRALAKLMWGDESPLGKIMTDTDGNNAVTVVGVIEHFYNPYGWPIHEYATFIPGRAGNHDVKFGVQWQHSQSVSDNQGNLNGTFAFTQNNLPFDAGNFRTYPDRLSIRVPGASRTFNKSQSSYGSFRVANTWSS